MRGKGKIGKNKQERLHSDIICHRNSTYSTIPFMVNCTELCKETYEEMAKAMSVVSLRSVGLQKISFSFLRPMNYSKCLLPEYVV